MKTPMLLTLFLLVSLGSSGTYQLGSHSVSFNLSGPAEYMSEVPLYQPNSDAWTYGLNITPKTGGYLEVLVTEGSVEGASPLVTQLYAETRIQNAKNIGIGGYMYEMTTYQNHTAFQESYPAQTVYKNRQYISLPEAYAITYALDGRTSILITSLGANELFFEELLNSLNITRNDKNQVTEHKSFLGPTSAYAGAGKGAKPGMENQNAVTVLGDSQSSNITVTSHGVK